MELGSTAKELNYPDSDIAVMVSMNRIFYLHQHTLRRNSEVFAALLRQYNASQNLNNVKKNRSQKPILMLKRSNRSSLGNWAIEIELTASWGYNENGLGVDETLNAYSNLFRIMYNLPPTFLASDIDGILIEAERLQDVADHIKASNSASGPIELELSRLGQSLYRSIARAPWAWIEFSRRLKSPSIFKEALVHLVGQYRQLDHETLELLSEPVKALAEKKLKALEIKKKAIELRIMGHYPEVLEPSEHAVRSKTERTEYSAAIYHWMTLCFFRQWFGQMISRGFGATGVDGGATLYRWIHMGREAYLNMEDIQEFKKTFSCSHKADKIIAGHVATLKTSLRAYVEELMISNSAHDDPSSLPYLTCIPVENNDLPWVAASMPPNRDQGKMQIEDQWMEDSLSEEE